ncbi:MAG TPA: hypothetical protein VKB88_00125 [Bryobacteraceae bacterium]|nr:hypothetical protein [Bryobacteraceae bacterium]
MPVFGIGRDSVINQCLAFIFRKDKPFAMWMASQGIGAAVATNGTTMQPASTKPAKRESQLSAIQERLTIAQEVCHPALKVTMNSSAAAGASSAVRKRAADGARATADSGW